MTGTSFDGHAPVWRRAAGPLTRRALLRRATVLGLSAAGGAALLAACGSNASPSPAAGQSAGGAAATTQPTSAPSGGTTAPGSSSSPAASNGGKNVPAGGTAVVANYAMPVDLDPGKVPGFQSWFVLQNICEGLVELVATPDGKIDTRPVLADKYEKSADGGTWTFTLKRGVTFHDGTSFNAQAVVFSHDRMMNPNNPYYNQLFASLGQPLSQIIDKVDAVDDGTVRFTLKNPPNPYFLNWEAFALVVSPDAVKKTGKDFGTKVVGTGPFRLDKFDAAGKTIETSKNPNYWASGLPRLDKVVWKAVDEPATRLAMLETSDADVATIMPPELAPRIKNNPQLALVAANVPNFNMVEFYHTVPPFDDLRLRQAVAYALDRNALASTLYGGYWKAAINNRWPGMPGWEDTQPYPHDPEKAKALLQQAGHANGLEFTLDMPSSSSGNPAGQRWGEAIQDQLSKVGITVKLNVMESGAYWNYITTPRPNTAHYMTRQVFVGDVVNEWLIFWIKPTKGSSEDAAVAGLPDLYTQLQQTADPAQYTAIVTKMWQTVDEQLPYIAIADGSWLTGQRKALQGFTPAGLGEYLSLRAAGLAQ